MTQKGGLQFDIFVKKNCLHYSCAFYFTSMVAPLLKWGTKRFFYTWSSKGHTALWLIWLITVQKLWWAYSILNLTAKNKKSQYQIWKQKLICWKKLHSGPLHKHMCLETWGPVEPCDPTKSLTSNVFMAKVSFFGQCSDQ